MIEMQSTKFLNVLDVSLNWLVVKKTEKQLIAEDIWQVIRHELWKDGENKSEWCVDVREPLKVSKEPLPKMMKVK